jgi:chitinase
MAYDFSGPWSPQSSHHAALYPSINTPGTTCADTTVQYILSQPNVLSRKIVLGIPCYGRAFGRAPSSHPFPLPSSTQNHGEGHGRAIEVRDLPLPGTVESIDEMACAAYCQAVESGGEWVTYDNATTVTAKARYVRDRQLGGLVFWEGCQDRETEELSLVLAGYVGLYGTGVGMKALTG